VQISVNGGVRVLAAEPGKPLLSTLVSSGIHVPSACGGRGSCGLCRVTVERGAGEYTPAELALLSREDQARGMHLACQVLVDRSLAIRIPGELFRVREHVARVASLRDLTHDIREVVLALEDPPEMAFVAGQYVQLVIPPIALGADPAYRVYSVASPPSRSGTVELEVRRVPGGVGTSWVFGSLRVGDSVRVIGPFGDLCLRDSDREIIFVAGGSGMAPIKSMLTDMAEKGSTRPATYYFTARSARDLFLLDEMRCLERRLPALSFVPTLSHPLAEDRWEGETGSIAAVLARKLGTLDRHEAYLCGSAGMVDAAVRVLTSRGLSPELIFHDRFV
jgi:Na+-transporting NADH:ubiquinone oxidoreductase subunit F